MISAQSADPLPISCSAFAVIVLEKNTIVDSAVLEGFCSSTRKMH